MKSIDYEYIETPSALAQAARDLCKSNEVAVDLEADSMYHFKEKVCLIQFATRSANYVVDPLRLADLTPLKALFENRDILKIFHGSDYDIRSLYRDFNIEVNNLFDTELACRFLGITETGLEATVAHFFNIQLDKRYQKKDWSKRPLPTEMIDYAARDVVYLLSMRQKLTDRLVRLKRLDWVQEECELLSRVRANSNNQQPLYLKFKGAGRLDPRTLAVLENILVMRKALAEKKDRPLFKVLGSHSIVTIAQQQPTTVKHLQELGAVSTRQINMYGKKLVACVNKALALPEGKLPKYPRKKAPSLPGDVPPRVKALQRWRAEKAQSLNMDPGTICNKALLTRIAQQNPDTVSGLDELEEMKSWQRAALGEEIVSVLSENRVTKRTRGVAS
ncbi:MAG: ribonuclease D [Deltaproteobacteria bacterium]|nr:ribonuclease D [Deltaproteobacteria bacterium]